MTTKLYKSALRHVIPYIRFSAYYPSIKGKDYQAGYIAVQPGHIILTIDYKKLTTLLIPGTFAHAALCVDVGTVKSPEVLEMTHTDFTESWFFDLCKEADRVVIMDCFDWDDKYKKRVIEQAWSYKASLYDAEFSLGVDALYCSELIYQADFERRLKCDLSDLAGLGRPYISPDGLLFSENVRVVWDSSNELTGLTGPECEKILYKT